MKSSFAMLALSATLTAYSQTAPSATANGNQNTLNFNQPPADYNSLYVTPRPPNQLSLDGVSCSGIVPLLLKNHNPLQLINPFAPPEYGSGFDNLVPGTVKLDSNTSRPTGLKLFSISF